MQDLNQGSSRSSGNGERGTGLRDAKDVELAGLSHYVDQCLWGGCWIQILEEGAKNKSGPFLLFVE